MPEQPCIIKGCVNLADWQVGSHALCGRCRDEMTGTPVYVWQPFTRWARRKVRIALLGWSA